MEEQQRLGPVEHIEHTTQEEQRTTYGYRAQGIALIASFTVHFAKIRTNFGIAKGMGKIF
jgi:hypothetical protein